MFKPHNGACQYPGCTKTNTLLVVKKLWCATCNYKHKQDKKKKEGKPSSKYVYKRVATGEAELFSDIWAESNQRCFVCDKPIIYPIAANFAHILPKALNKY